VIEKLIKKARTHSIILSDDCDETRVDRFDWGDQSSKVDEFIFLERNSTRSKRRKGGKD
jgi:hypothetical protein